jgi:hypothetical protein
MDAAAHMLKKVGDHIAPLTRFDASHLKIVACVAHSVPVAATQTFTARFAAKTSDGLGALPDGVRKVSGKGALEDALAEMLARATSAAARRLEAWSATHGADPAAAPGVDDIFTSEGEIGYAWMCATCHGAGKTDCSLCQATGQIKCVQCGGVGKTTCSHCNGTTRMPCSACGGRGGQSRQVEHRGWNPATNEQTVRYEQVWEPCIRCGGQRTEHCTSCSGGRVACSGCGGKGANTCSVCQGEGRKTCGACKGKGELHHVASVGCEITPSLSIEAGGEDASARTELSAIGSIDRLLSLAGDASVHAETSGLDFRRTTSAAVRCSAATFAAGRHRLTINGYGPDFEILDFRDIGGALLTGDVETLEAALNARTGLIPALHGMLESETNAEIARRSGAMSSKKRDAEMTKLAAELRGVASPAYAVRASNAIRKGVSRAYVSRMLQWPVFTLAAGALALPANWLAWTSGVRNQDMPLIVGIMLLAAAAAFVGDRWATGALQKDLSSRADLKIPPLIGKLGLTRNWMILACIVAIPLATVCGAIGRVWAGF